jgi:hypothetical protein
VYKEIQLFNAGAKRLGEDLRAELKSDRWRSVKSWRCWGDPAGTQRAQTDEKTAFQILETFGFSIRPGAIDWESRKQAVIDRAQLMIDGEPGLLIDYEGCPTLCDGLMGGYRYAKSGERVSPQPLKNEYSHPCDALQYLCTGEFDAVSSRPTMLKTANTVKDARARWDPLHLDEGKGRGGWMGN